MFFLLSGVLLQEKVSLQAQLRNIQQDVDQLREQLEEESEMKSQSECQFAKINNEYQTLRARVEAEGLGVSGPEIEEIKYAYLLLVKAVNIIV